MILGDKKEKKIMLRKLQFFVFCLGMLQSIIVTDILAVEVDIDLKKNQTLNLLYNQPFPNSIYSGGEYSVNAFMLDLFFELFPSSGTIASFKLYSDSNEVLWEFTDSVEAPPEHAGSCNVGFGFDFYDESVWGSPYHNSNPAININQFRDGIGDDNFLLSITIIEGSLRVKGYEISFMHTESSSSSSAFGSSDMDTDHYDFDISPAPPVITPMILQLLLK